MPEEQFFKRNGAKKDRAWNDKDKPLEVREKWVEMMNGAMERHGRKVCMTDDELLLIYSSMRKFTDSMNAREQVLDQKTAALDAAIAQLQQLPLTLGKQTSQYIAMGVRQSIQDDFSRPLRRPSKSRFPSSARRSVTRGT